VTVRVAVLIPVLARPQNAFKVVASLVDEPRARPLFLLSPGDNDELAAVRMTGCDHLIVPWDAGDGDWARKINLGCTLTAEPFVFTGADDLEFQAGWLDACLAQVSEGGDGGWLIGTNDDANPLVKRGQHSTHSLVSRDYVERGTVDEPGKLLHEGYRHQWVDNELVETAMARRRWRFAAEARVLHHHPIFDRTVARDATYMKALSGTEHDRELFRSRRHLWRSR